MRPIDPRQFRRNPDKPAFRLSDLKPRNTTEQERWRAIIKSDAELVKSVRLNQNTLRLAKLVPTWEIFASTEYFHFMRRALGDDRFVRKYKAWWQLLLACHHRMLGRQAFGYGYALLCAEVINRKSAGQTHQIVRWEKFKLPEALAAEIRECVLSNYESLTLA